MKFNPIPLITIFLLTCYPSFSQTEPRYTLYLKSGAFIPEKNISPENIEAFSRQATQASGRQFAVIQFEKIPSAAQRLLLEKSGVELLDYIPDNAYTVTVSGTLDASLLASLHARSLIQLSPQQKNAA